MVPLRYIAAFFFVSSAPAAAQLIDAPGREQVVQLCSKCHEVERSVSKKQDRTGWQETLIKMKALGTKGSDEEFAAILDYLAKNYAAEEIPPLNVNKAKAIDLESRLSIRRSQAAAILAWRRAHGDFKSVEDLLKVPGIDAAKIEAKKDILAF